MKSTFTAKYLQHLVRKNKGNEGFTLIELLVVIIIVGVLAAIALPSFLNQIGKARASEAKANLGTINTSQQSYRLERNTFASTLSNLDAKISGRFYSYVINGGATADTATVNADRGTNTDIKSYSGGVRQTLIAGTDFFSSVICEAAQATPGTAPTAVAPATTGIPGTCGTGNVVE